MKNKANQSSVFVITKICKKIIFLLILTNAILSCKKNENLTPTKEPVVLVSRVKALDGDVLFGYDATGRLIDMTTKNVAGVEIQRFTFSYQTDGKLSLINTEYVRAQKGSYKFTWLNATEATIEGIPLSSSKVNMKLTVDLKGKPLDLQITSGGGSMLTNQYVYKYDSKGNRVEIDPNLPGSTKGKVSSTIQFDDKKSPFATNYQAITLLDAFENVGAFYFYTLPFGALNNPLDQTRGNTESWTYKYQYNTTGYPVEIAAEFRDTRFTPVKLLTNKFSFEYITQ